MFIDLWFCEEFLVEKSRGEVRVREFRDMLLFGGWFNDRNM